MTYVDYLSRYTLILYYINKCAYIYVLYPCMLIFLLSPHDRHLFRITSMTFFIIIIVVITLFFPFLFFSRCLKVNFSISNRVYMRMWAREIKNEEQKKKAVSKLLWLKIFCIKLIIFSCSTLAMCSNNK